MKENEAKAVKFIQNIKNHAVVTLDHIVNEEPNVSPLVYKGRKEKANTILAMVEELQQYRAIGTVEECREAVEKQKAKRPDGGRDIEGNDYLICPNCCAIVVDGEWVANFCHDCGQKLDWSGSDEKKFKDDYMRLAKKVRGE